MASKETRPSFGSGASQPQLPDQEQPSYPANAFPMNRNKRRRRKVGFSLLALTLAASTASGFTSLPSRSVSCCLVSADSPRSTPKPLFLPTLSSTKTAPAVALEICSNSAPRQQQQRPKLLSVWKRRTQNAVGKLFPSARDRRKEVEEDYERRKQEWAALYTNVDALRDHFGGNKNKLWGDLDATTGRRLYKTLLPKALLELYRVGVKPEDLAPLAYEARVAAKLYARERCQIPARLAAHGYDGFRQWRRYGEFQIRGMSYSQVWDKYKNAILEEVHNDDLEEEDVTARICLKILERSCQTNERIDRWVLGVEHNHTPDMVEQERDLATITEQLERDVFEVLEGHRRDTSARRASTLRMLVRAKRRLEKLQAPTPSATDALTKDIQMKMMKEGERSGKRKRDWEDPAKKSNNRERQWDERVLKDHHP